MKTAAAAVESGDLPLPAEPLDVLRRFESGMESNRWLAVANLRQGGWLAPELWRLWQPWLEKKGFTQQQVQDLVSDCSPYFMRWIEHEMEWEQAISNVIRTIQAPH